MARDDQKKTTSGRNDTNATEEPKKGTRARPTSAKSAAKGATKGRSDMGNPAKPPADSKTPSSASGQSAGGAQPSTRSKRNEPTERDFREPSHDEIAHRAHQVWLETGNPDALENWIQAERELRARHENREPQD